MSQYFTAGIILPVFHLFKAYFNGAAKIALT